VAATHENLSYGAKSTEFMAPPSFAFELMRKAVLSLAVKHPFLNSLINPRQTSAITYATSPLNAADRSGEFTTGPVPGQPLQKCAITIVENGAAGEAHLTDLVTPSITGFYFSGDGAIPAALPKIEADMRADGIPFALVNLTRHLNSGATEKHGHTGRLFDMYNATPDSPYLVFPLPRAPRRPRARSLAPVRCQRDDGRDRPHAASLTVFKARTTMTHSRKMTDSELDAACTHLCRTMTRLGEAQAPLFLARFALLAMTRIGDRDAVRTLVDAAADMTNETT
jgi:hypothetical protein